MEFFSGLENLGIKGLENLEIYSEEMKSRSAADEKERKVQNALSLELECLYDKTFTCPVCNRKFVSRTLKSSKSKLVSLDFDLRPVHQNIDGVKYDVVACPHCGYASLGKFFGPLTDMQVRKIKDTISNQFIPQENENKACYSYDEAIERSKLALLSCIIKGARDSERAYVCLKTAWLYRGKAETLDMSEVAVRKDCKKDEDAFLRKAYDGLLVSRQKETFPICGMDEMTYDYLLAALAYHVKDYEVAARLVGEILTSGASSPRLKEKTRSLKEDLKKAILEMKK